MSASSHSGDRPALLGGTPGCGFAWPEWPARDATEEQALCEVLRSGQWWYGERVARFERAFANFQGAAFGVTCTNGTTALEMALRAVGVVAGDEVIVPPYSFVATASSVVTVGAIPVFADIEADTLCLDPDDVARKITPRTRAIIPVHVGGRCADMRRINELAERFQLVVVEDAAHAWGSQLENRGAGTWGRCGTFSFQVSKNITAGEGGIVVTDDEEIADLCRSFSHCGRTKTGAWYDHDLLGSNLRLTEFQAAVLQTQLARLPEQIARRERAAAFLTEALADISCLRPQAAAPDMQRRSYHLFILRLNETELGLSRDRFITALEAEGIPATAGWYRPLYKNGVFARAHIGPRHGIRAPLAGLDVNYTNVECPVCEQVCRDAVWLPHHVLLADESQLELLVAAVRKVVAHAPALRTATDGNSSR